MTENRTTPAEALTVRQDVAPARAAEAAPPGGRKLGPAPRARWGGPMAAALPADSLLVVLWRSRWIMLICLLAALDGGIAYIQNVTPLYTSTAKLYLDYAGVRLSNPYEPGSRPQTDKYLCTQAELIKSRPILAPVETALAAQGLRTFAQVEAPLAYLQRNLVVEVGKKDEVISIALRCPYASEAADVVNGVMDAYLKNRSDHEQHNLMQLLGVLENSLQRTDAELDHQQKQLTDFQRTHLPLALGSQQGGDATQRNLEYHRNAHTQAELEVIDAENYQRDVRALAPNPTALRQYVQRKGSAGTYVNAEQEKASLEARINDLKHEKETLLKTVTPGYPKVVTLTAEIARLEAKVKELDDRFVQAVLADAAQGLAGAKQKEAQVAQLCRAQEAQATTFNRDLDEYQRLHAKVEHLTTTSQTLDQQVRDIRKVVGEDVGQLRMEVLERAQPALNPSEPQVARVMALALILGLLLGGGAAVARDWLSQTLRSADEIAALLHVPVLGVVPAMSRRRHMQDRGRKVLLQPDSHEAEAFRTIRTAVLFGAAPQGAKTMLITSPAAGDGKSTLVSNLAIALANAGQKTLILDADLRKPSQHTIFGLDPYERCLANVFAGTMTLAAAVQPSGIEGLHVLTGGYRVANAAEVLNSKQFAQLLTCLTDVYDRIVIDAPPVTVVTDAQILGALCDATVLVLRADRSARRVALHAIDALQSVGARLLGVVVNEVRRSGQRYGYYYDRYHRYYGAHTPHARGSQTPSSAVVPLCVGSPSRVPDSALEHLERPAEVLPVKTASEGA